MFVVLYHRGTVTRW